MEYENPTLFGTVHHLTVACYWLQHNAYARDTWIEARQMVAQFIHPGLTPAAVRKQNRSRLDSSRRTWRITNGEKLAEFDAIVWTRTIADVRLDDPTTYCADIIQWATAILADTDALMQQLGQPPQPPERRP